MPPLRALCAALLASLPYAAQATTIEVDTLADQYGGDTAHCSLREALQAANTDAAFGGCVAGSGTDLISLGAGIHVLTRSGRDEDANATGDLDVTSSVVVLGIDAEQTIVDARGIDRVFHVRESSPVITTSFINLTITGGDAVGNAAGSEEKGGGFLAERQTTLSLRGAHVRGNRAWKGGGINADSWSTTLSVVSSTLSGNASTHTGGAVYTSRAFDLTNSTVSGNTSNCTGSALMLGAFAETHIESSTIVDNHGVDCGYHVVAPAIWSGTSSAIPHVRNTIIAANYSGPIEANCDEIVSDDYNLLGNVEECGIDGITAHVLTGFDPQVAPLFDYGGKTPTHALLPGSPAIAAGGGCSSADQRGVVRNACDIGAYAYRPTFTVNEASDAIDANPGDGTCATAAGRCTLRAAIMESNERTAPSLLVLPAGDYPLTIERLGEDPENTGWLWAKPQDSLMVFGAGAGRTRIIGMGNEDAMFYADGGATAIASLSVSGGNQTTVSTAGGIAMFHARLMLQDVEIADSRGCHGGLSVSGTALLDRVSIHGNAADGSCPRVTGGGIHVAALGELQARNITVSGNHAVGGGGGIAVDGGTARLLHATVAANTAGEIATPADGGGLHRASTGQIYLKNSIVAGNLASGSGDDCSALVQSLDFNLIGNVTGCTIGGQTAGNVTGVDARLDPLADGGNGLPVHGLAPSSPALGAVGTDNDDRVSACRGTDGRLTLEDQRRQPRDPYAFCDIGAYEGVGDRLFADAFER